MVFTVDKPLEWYASALERGEPFVNMVYGDGEWLVMAGERRGERFTHYRETVTDRMREELLASLDVPGLDVVRATDLNLLFPDRYQGTDVDSVRAVHRRIVEAVGPRRLEFGDGTVWDTAAREGRLGPVFKALRGRAVVLVANYNVLSISTKYVRPVRRVKVPNTDAYAEIDRLEEECVADPPGLVRDDPVYVLCCGLGAIPLACRIRQHLPMATVLDLGSALDVFVEAGAERGWRAEAYADPNRLHEIYRLTCEGMG